MVSTASGFCKKILWYFYDFLLGIRTCVVPLFVIGLYLLGFRMYCKEFMSLPNVSLNFNRADVPIFNKYHLIHPTL